MILFVISSKKSKILKAPGVPFFVFIIFAPSELLKDWNIRLNKEYSEKVSGSFLKKFGAVSSVGLEHYLDRVGVTGSNPVQPTIFPFPGNNVLCICTLLRKI